MSTKYGYYHLRNNSEGYIEAKGGATVVFGGKVDVTEEAKQGDVIKINIGVSFCHTDDNYNKKIGRNIAKGRVKDTEFTIDYIEENSLLSLSGEEYNLLLLKHGDFFHAAYVKRKNETKQESV